MTSILGISAFYHDSAAAIIENGEIIAAAQEERFTRIKHDSEFPTNSVKFVLNYSKVLAFDRVPYIRLRGHFLKNLFLLSRLITDPESLLLI